MNDLKSRVFTGLLFGICMIAVNWMPIYIVIPFLGIFVGISAFEMGRMMNKNSNVNVDIGFSIFSSLLFYSTLSIGKILNVDFPLYAVLIIVFFILLLFELWRNVENALLNISSFIFLLVYCVIPFYLMMDLIINSFDKTFIFPLFLGLLTIIWLNDTMAYFVGRYFGKHLIFKRISPKKTWEGTMGGILFGILGAIAIGFLTNELSVFFWIIASILILPMAILGDFFESMLKRASDVKDSGSILPGHGGVLDRFDSLTFALPVYYFWILLYLFYI